LETELSARVEGRLPPRVEEGLYRIAQETLNNVLKHARASKVVVSVSQDAEEVRLEIRDDGVGFDPGEARETAGMGLSSVDERAVLMGGTLRIESTPGAGTTVLVEVPQ
jgi:signal transduction histidine kinase